MDRIQLYVSAREDAIQQLHRFSTLDPTDFFMYRTNLAGIVASANRTSIDISLQALLALQFALESGALLGRYNMPGNTLPNHHYPHFPVTGKS